MSDSKVADDFVEMRDGVWLRRSHITSVSLPNTKEPNTVYVYMVGDADSHYTLRRTTITEVLAKIRCGSRTSYFQMMRSERERLEARIGELQAADKAFRAFHDEKVRKLEQDRENDKRLLSMQSEQIDDLLRQVANLTPIPKPRG